MPATSLREVTVGVDVGGTFTDMVSFDPQTQRLGVLKFPTARDPAGSIVRGLRRMKVSPSRVVLFSHATTMSTNALLTREGLGKTALLTNEGFRDLIEIGRQRRPELYDLRTRRPPPLIERKDRFTVRCRIAADGTELVPMDEKEGAAAAAKILKGGYDSVAVAFLNSYANPKHEEAMRRLLADSGFAGHVSLSSGVDREYREYERISTTAVNAALAPLMAGYFRSLASKLKSAGVVAPLFVMNSDGGASTLPFASERPVYSIESGPAAGVVASKRLAAQLSIGDVLTFDMGGTTAKAGCLVRGEPELTREFEAAGRTHSGRSIRGSGYAVRGSFIDLAEVSAGGGTVAWADEAGQLRVGPRSAGSVPGPACYGRGGTEATVTDANVFLGRLSPTSFLGGSMPVKKGLATEAIRALARQTDLGLEGAASGVLRLANNMMSRAISIVSVERGRDPRDFTLFAFGGAGPLHCCDLAEDLGIDDIVVPAHAGLFSAYGLLAGDLERTFTAPFAAGESLERQFRALEASAGREMRSGGLNRYVGRRTFEARYRGQSHELSLPYQGTGRVKKAFDSRHRALYGYASRDEVEVVNISLKLKVLGRPSPSLSTEPSPRPAARRWSRAWVAGRRMKVEVLTREGLARGASGEGPVIVEEYDSTLLVNPGWRWKVTKSGTRLER